MKYKVTFKDWNNELAEVIADTKKDANALAKAVHGTISKINKGIETYLGHYEYAEDTIGEGKTPETVFFPADPDKDLMKA